MDINELLSSAFEILIGCSILGIFGIISWGMWKIWMNTAESFLGIEKHGKKIVTETKENMENTMLETSEGRIAVVKNFSDKYQLHLTKDQITNLVNASYVSQEWEQEIYEMLRVYNYKSPQDWISQGNKWVRAYMYVFSVQEISADYRNQEDIAKAAFNQIFEEMNQRHIEDEKSAISYINQKFYANLDEEIYKILKLRKSLAVLPKKDVKSIKKVQTKQSGKLKAKK